MRTYLHDILPSNWNYKNGTKKQKIRNISKVTLLGCTSVDLLGNKQRKRLDNKNLSIGYLMRPAGQTSCYWKNRQNLAAAEEGQNRRGEKNSI